MGSILLSGSFFVFIVISLSDRTIREMNMKEQLEEINKQLRKNIEKRKKAEGFIAKQNKFLNRVMESLTHPFYVIDVYDYRIVAANSAARFGGLTDRSTCYSLTHKRNKSCGGSERVCPLEEMKKTGKPVTVEHIHYDKDNNIRNVEVHAYPIFNEDDNLTQMIEYALDITERRKALDKLKITIKNNIRGIKN
jgi:PAS domain-containing protein